MRTDFRSVLTHGAGNRYPDAEFVRAPILDDEDGHALPGARTRDLRKGWREGNNLRHAMARRYLASQVGRAWGAVHSDIVRTVGHELRADVFDWNVDLDVSIDASGEAFDGRGYRVNGLYVDPRDGILRTTVRRSHSAGHRIRERRRLLTDPELVPLTDPLDPLRRADLRRIAGVWYEFTHRRSLAAAYGCAAVVVALDGERCTAYEHVARKRQLASGEIRRLGLRDWPLASAALRAATGKGRDDIRLAARLDAIRSAAVRAFLAGGR